MIIPRTLTPVLAKHMFRGKAIVLIGARQVGKSTLMQHLIKIQNDKSALFLNCDDPEVQELLKDPTIVELESLVGKYEILFIDEAQRIENIGLTLKRILEKWPQKQLLVTGSSSLDLHNSLDEPLTGRKYEYYLYPISTDELVDMPSGVLNANRYLEQRMIYGSYPEIIDKKSEARELLLNLTSSYLYKDILQFNGIRKSALLDKLLKALALQLGSEVSFNELAQITGSDSKTVEKYINLLEKCFVIFQLPALSRNMRNELKKSKKIMFWDTGIRNTIIQNFAPLEIRTDKGPLWENFFIVERIKFMYNNLEPASYYFWRTTDKQEIDLIEEKDGVFNLFEMKSSPNVKTSFPKSFLSNYEVGIKAVVTPQNYLQYTTGLKSGSEG